MCGIAGFIDPRLGRDGAAVIGRMTDRIVHRGPDDAGYWIDEQAGVALGHRRLSILDLSPAGHQPMFSPSGRYVVSYNGEIYNHHDLRQALEAGGAAPAWRGHSDTEVLAATIDEWGIEEALRRSNGMFAFAVWDRRDRTLYLARDRLGEKPLYYGMQGGVFLFGSELKALTAHPAFEHEIDRAAVALFVRRRYVPAPLSIWKGIQKLPPAHYVVVKDGRLAGPPIRYWDFDRVAREGQQAARGGDRELVDELDEVLRDAVACRMEADVPLGAFLSGGIDSSAIVAMMQRESTRRVQTFSIGFHEKEYDEAGYAKAVAEHLGTEHTELYVTPADALAVIPELPAIWDEPFSDPSQIPTYLLSKLTRAHVKVSLSGDGGDELFGGYERYFRAAKLWRRASRMPRGLKVTAASVLGSSAAAAAGAAIDVCLPRGKKRSLGHRLPLLSSLLLQRDTQGFYGHFISHWKDPALVVLDADAASRYAEPAPPPFADFCHTMMYHDTLNYLPDDVLTKVDRASMAASLEARVPFLDHRVVELAWRAPMSAKIRAGTGKWLLREVLWKYVPRHLVERPKSGFAVPINRWLRGPLREWAEDLLDERRLKEEAYFMPGPIRKKWTEHLNGQGQWHFYLWDILMFQAWLEEQRAPASGAQSVTAARAVGASGDSYPLCS